MNFKDHLRRGRYLLRCCLGMDVFARIQERCPKIHLGNDQANWCVCPKGLSSQSVVYSFGVGTDISFDLEMIRLFGMQVHAFDPTPRSVAWVNSQTLPPNFIFHEYGIGNQDGSAAFHPPQNPDFVSYSIFSQVPTDSPPIQAPIQRLTSIMRILGHAQIDVLKMDIEGAEYGVLADLMVSRPPVRQLLVEFHHRLTDIGPKVTRETLRNLNSMGFRIFHISPRGEEYSLLRSEE